MGNGPEMDFSAPPDAQGHPGVFTPEDAFVAAANTCIMMMFIWAAERFKLNLISYDCRAEGTKLIELDRTEIFTHLRFWPVVRIAAGNEDPEVVRSRTKRGLQSAQKYSLVANSVKYALGRGVPIVLAGTFAGVLKGFRSLGKWSGWFEKASGIIILLVGVHFLWIA